jgi:hypothetical protein
MNTTNEQSRTRYRKSDAIKQLERMSFDAKREKYHGIHEKYLAPERFRDDTANGLTKCIITYITLCGGQAERINCTGRQIDRRTTYTDVTGVKRTIGSYEWVKGSGCIGTADISATIQGRSVKIEVKIGRDRQSDAQKEYQKKIEKAGGVYIIVRDFEQFLNWYSHFINRRQYGN